MQILAMSWLILYSGIVILGVVLAILLVSYQKKIAETQERMLATQQEVARQLGIIASRLHNLD